MHVDDRQYGWRDVRQRSWDVSLLEQKSFSRGGERAGVALGELAANIPMAGLVEAEAGDQPGRDQMGRGGPPGEDQLQRQQRLGRINLKHDTGEATLKFPLISPSFAAPLQRAAS